MNLEQLREQLEFDEGCVYEIYNDHLGYATFGIGHLVTEWDEEYGWEVGTPVNEDRCIECFDTDIQIVLSDCDRLYPDFQTSCKTERPIVRLTDQLSDCQTSCQTDRPIVRLTNQLSD